MMQTRRFIDVAKTCCAGLLAGLACTAGAQAIPAVGTSSALPGTYAVSLKQYNRHTPSNLHGVDGRSGIAFGIRADERIKNLQLDLAYHYSTALLEDLSHLNVILNGEVIASLPLPAQQAEHAGQARVNLPLDYLQPYNYLELQLIGHYTMDCEDPRHADLWVNLDESSRLVFDVERVVLPDDLSILPAPFFDPRDVRSVKVPFVLRDPSDKRLEAAGVVASWLGARAGYRGAHFTVESGGIPERGHAVIVLGNNESLPGVALPPPEGPTVTMYTNPRDSAGKLLIVTGRDDDEIRSAAVALALGAEALSGPTATFEMMRGLPRKPYDAPNWLPTDRPIALGELLPLRGFSVSGSDPVPITVGLRLPPDLSDWRTKMVPLELLYRHSAADEEDRATLDVLVNQQRLQRIELANNAEAARQLVVGDGAALRQTVQLPLSALESQADLQFKFQYRPPFQSECRGSVIDVRRSAIDPRSTIDLSGLPHHKAMPDLAAFGTSGFPFTRMADLSETMVVLAPAASLNEYSAFLSVLGKMGQVTGYPATGVAVTRGGSGVDDKDLLLIEAGPRSEMLSGWIRHLPEARRGAPLSSPVAGQASAPAGGAYVAGFESPVSEGRSVVVLAGADGASLQAAVHLMNTDEVQKSRLQGSLALVRDGRIESLSDSKTYYAGSLGAYQAVAWFLSRHPGVLFMLYMLGAVLIATVLYLSLRDQARGRLSAAASNSNKHKENS